MYSSIVPGFGQLYNRQYWKLPIVYGVVAVSTYFITTNLTLYQSYRKAYINRLSNPAFVNDDYGTLYTVTQLKQLQDDPKKIAGYDRAFFGYRLCHADHGCCHISPPQKF